MENILLAIIGLSAAGYVIRLVFRQIKGGGSCSCSEGCQGCRLKDKGKCK